jgi:hypothetical protein
MKRSTLSCGLILGLLFLSPLAAQPRGDARRGQNNTRSSGMQDVARRFENAAPGVGTPLPEISAYDADGRPFELKNRKGSYTVLVFGCLT